MEKLAIKLGLIVAVIVAAYFSLMKLNLLPGFLDLRNLYKTKELELEPMALIVDNVKSIAQLFTSNYYGEFKHIEAKKTEALFGLKQDEHELIIISKGTCFAGTDLSKLASNDIEITDSANCRVKIPKAEIIDIVMNPSDFDIYEETGTWSPDEVKKAKENAKEKLRERAMESKILDKANDRSKQIFTDFLKSLGYKNVAVELKN